MTVKKAVIPAAGLGTRMLPATKAQPKEMLPIVDKPAIQYIVEEAVEAGIENILIVTGRNKKTIEDHFDKIVELEQTLLEKHKSDLLAEVRRINRMASIHFIRQQEPLGLGHAILCAQPFVGGDPFAVLLGDDILLSETSPMRSMIRLFEERNRHIVGVQPVPERETGKYGIIDPLAQRHRIFTVRDLVEKPAPHEAPSNIAIMGRYILKPSIFGWLKTIERGAGNEYQLTDALREACRTEGLLAYELEGQRYDIGDKLGFLKATIDIALQRDDLREQLLAHLEGLDAQRPRKLKMAVKR